MGDPLLDSSWGEAAKKIASEFDERLGSPSAEIVTFASAERAIAVGIAPAGSCERLPIGRLLEAAMRDGRPRGSRRPRRGKPAARSKGDLRELARVHRVIVLGVTRCVNRVYLLHGAGNKLYALHGVGVEDRQDELRTDMDAVVARLAHAD